MDFEERFFFLNKNYIVYCWRSEYESVEAEKGKHEANVAENANEIGDLVNEQEPFVDEARRRSIERRLVCSSEHKSSDQRKQEPNDYEANVAQFY